MWIVKNREKAHLLKLACKAYKVSYQEVLNKAENDFYDSFDEHIEDGLEFPAIVEINDKDGNTQIQFIFEYDEIEEV